MFLMKANTAAELTGIPYSTFAGYTRAYPFLAWHDKNRLFSATQGPARLFVPRGLVTVLALMKAAYGTGLNTPAVDTILRILPFEQLINEWRLPEIAVYYPSSAEAQLVTFGGLMKQVDCGRTYISFPLAQIEEAARNTCPEDRVVLVRGTDVVKAICKTLMAQYEAWAER